MNINTKKVVKVISVLLSPLSRKNSAYLYISFFSLLINILSPLLISLSYNQLVFAEEQEVQQVTSSNSSSETDSELTDADESQEESTTEIEDSETETQEEGSSTDDTSLSDSTEEEENISPSPTPSSEPIEPSQVNSPTPTPEAAVSEGDILDPGAESERVEIPDDNEVSGKECVDQVDNLSTSKNESWETDKDANTSTTKEPVKLGVRYEFPLESGVSITFKCLPKDPGLRTSLKIRQVKVSELDLPQDVSIGTEYAYDITTGMDNGTFTYDLVLPKPQGVKTTVLYTEKSAEEAKAGLSADDIKEVKEEEDFINFAVTCQLSVIYR